MAQNNQGWREGHRYENRNLQGDAWQNENSDNRNAWQGDYEDEYGDRRYRRQQQERDENRDNWQDNEGNYPTAQRSNRYGNRNGGGYGLNNRYAYNPWRSGPYNREPQHDRDADRWNEFNNDWNNERRRLQNNDPDRFRDDQGFRNPAAGSMDRYGEYDRTGRNTVSWSDRNSGLNDRNRDMDRYNYKGKGPKGYRRSDDRIEEDINDRLTDHNDLDASSIDVSVSQGDVTLKGTVDNRRSKRLAEDIAEMVSGVQNVENRIRVQQETDAETSLYNKKHSTSESPDHQGDRKATAKAS